MIKTMWKRCRPYLRNSQRSAMIAGAVVVIMALSPVPGHTQDGALTKVSFAGSVTWLGMVPVMVALEKGFYKEAGLDLDYRVVLNSSDRIRAITAGDISFSNVGSVAVLTDMSRGNESFSIFANVDDSPGNEGCWARPGFTSASALKGKTVAANSSAEITMHGVLAAAGMSAKDIKYINLSPNELAPALNRGDIDAACVWEPLLSGLKAAVPNGHLVGMDTDTPMYKKFGTMSAPDVMIMSRQLIDKTPKIATAIASATFKGADFARDNPEEAAKLVAKYFRKAPEEILPGIKSFKYFGFAGWSDHLKKYQGQFQELANWLHENKKIENAPTVDRWVNTSFIPKP